MKLQIAAETEDEHVEDLCELLRGALIDGKPEEERLVQAVEMISYSKV